MLVCWQGHPLTHSLCLQQGTCGTCGLLAPWKFMSNKCSELDRIVQHPVYVVKTGLSRIRLVAMWRSTVGVAEMEQYAAV